MSHQKLVEAAASRFGGIQDVLEIQMNLLGMETRDERGAITIETAVITAILAVIAVAAGVILIGKMRSNAAAIPDTPVLPS